jgi:hypothetical protein
MREDARRLFVDFVGRGRRRGRTAGVSEWGPAMMGRAIAVKRVERMRGRGVYDTPTSQARSSGAYMYTYTGRINVRWVGW